MATFKPTPEQENCVAQFATGKKLRINAYAGTGKTSTLKLLGRSTPKLGTYLAFNKSIADEAGREFPKTVSCSTTHSLAFRAMVKEFGVPKMTGNLNGGFIAMKLGLRSKTVAPSFEISARSWGYLMLEVVRSFMRSGRPEITYKDIKLDGKLAKLEAEFAVPMKDALLADARALWKRMSAPGDELPMTHDGYLKLWAMRKPKIPGQFIFLDEAQDTNGVVLELMKHQQAQVVAVGDKHQQIYEWRGAINAMVELPCELEARLATSFRFGPRIAEYASMLLGFLGETVPLNGNPAKTDRIGHIERPNAVLARNNATLIEILVHALDDGKRPYVVGGTDEMLSYVAAAESLQQGRPVDKPLDFFGYTNWNEVREASDEPEGADLRRWVKLIDSHGTDGLRKALEGLPKQEKDGAFTLSTGHKSKGRQWASVTLCDDFLLGVRTDEDDKEKRALETAEPSDHSAELRLLYVAATRGQSELEVHPQLTAKLSKITGIPVDELRKLESGAAPTAMPKQQEPAVTVLPEQAAPPKRKRKPKAKPVAAPEPDESIQITRTVDGIHYNAWAYYWADRDRWTVGCCSQSDDPVERELPGGADVYPVLAHLLSEARINRKARANGVDRPALPLEV